MQNKKNSKSNISQDEINSRLQNVKHMQDLERVHQEMKSGTASSSNASFDQPSGTAPTSGAPEDLRLIGREEDELYQEVTDELNSLLEKAGELAFSSDRKETYFPDDKILGLLRVLKKSRLEMECRIVMDSFKSRVKEKNGGKVPKISERQGIFGKSVERLMKPEEIARKYTIEDDLPPNDENAKAKYGTKNGLLNLLSERLLQNDEVVDPIKHGARKPIGLFLEALGVFNLQSNDKEEKLFIACFYTPEQLRPGSRNDKERLVKFRSILSRGNKWAEKKIEEMRSPAGDQENGEQEQDKNTEEQKNSVSA